MNDKPKDGRVQTVTLKNDGAELELEVSVSGFLEGDISNWPANIQDPIYKELEKTISEMKFSGKLPHDISRVEIVMSKCDKDEEGFYIHVIAVASKMKVQATDHVLKEGRVIN